MVARRPERSAVEVEVEVEVEMEWWRCEVEAGVTYRIGAGGCWRRCWRCYWCIRVLLLLRIDGESVDVYLVSCISYLYVCCILYFVDAILPSPC